MKMLFGDIQENNIYCWSQKVGFFGALITLMSDLG